MSQNNSRIGSQAAPWTRTNRTGMFHSPGPFIGIVKGNIDPTRSGRLRVFIPEFGAANEDDPSSWITVSYATPFRGQTRSRIDVDHYTDPFIDFTSQSENSFQSYGFWAVPPDLNIRVLIIFVNGNISQGYWFACIGDSIDSHMIPGIGSVPAAIQVGDGGYLWRPTGSNAIPSHTLLQNYIQLVQNGETEIPYRLPVSEPVLSAQSNANPLNPAQVLMVPQVYQTKQLGIQGLAFDFIRGSTTASSIRENPSQVFGINTPGRLVNFANIAASSNVLTQIQSYLNSNTITADANLEKLLTNSYRTGGHQFVMDDGTVDGYDQGIRIRSTNGNEVLLDDTNGQIYVINSQGTAWIEMSPSGYIDIYSKQFSVRAQEDINFHADNDINFNADGDINLNSGGDTRIDAGSAFTARASDDAIIYGSGSAQIGSQGSINLDGGGPSSMQSGGSLTFKGSKIKLNSGNGKSVTDPGGIALNNHIDVTQQNNSNVWWATGTYSSVVTRSPAHEPWPDHEINGIKTFNIKGFVEGGIVRGQSNFTSSGVRGTSKGKNINESDILKQIASGVVCGLNINQTRALFAQIGKCESGGNYTNRNSIGYSGKYQFGRSALITCHYIKNGTGGTNKTALDNSANWTGYNNCNSVNDWLHNPQAQEQAMLYFTQKNCLQLKQAGMINDNAANTGGLLMAAHLVGVGGAEKLYKTMHGQASSSNARTSDANGTTAKSYYDLGANAVQLGSSVK